MKTEITLKQWLEGSAMQRQDWLLTAELDRDSQQIMNWATMFRQSGVQITESQLLDVWNKMRWARG